MRASAAILAGGRATRFGGRDKSAIVVDGQTILVRQIAELSALTDDILLVTGEDHPAAALGARLVKDRTANAGPLAGLDAALESARYDSVILLACDMPFPVRELLAYMVTLADDADIVVPLTERGYHPLCAVYTRACAPAVARRLEHRELRMTGLFEDVRVRVVENHELGRFGDTARLLANVNTPAELDELQTLLGHKL
ncbi:MAG: NTP transferase domain-containing protein [Luteitalea sp.]|nr:NTP transferase domain-containing protein [Luteitalea sp.]